MRVSVREYFVTCFTGKFGWVPFSNLLHKDAHMIKEGDRLDYGNLSKQVCYVMVD